MFSVENIMFEFLGYQMSYLEFFGTLFNLSCVWLVAKNKILNWPVGIIGSVLFLILFAQIQLYSDVLEQVYFIGSGFWGWYVWGVLGKQKKEFPITRIPNGFYLVIILNIISFTVLLGVLTDNADVLFGIEPASYPYLDAFTTILSFAATIMLVRRKVEAWLLWIIVDIIGIGLYYQKDVAFISLLYVVFLVIATRGLFNWIRLLKEQDSSSVNSIHRI